MCPIHDPWQIWNLSVSNTIFSIICILKGLAHSHNKFSHWSDCLLTENSLRLKLVKCNQRYLPCKAEITIHLCCVTQTADFCKALRTQPSAVIPALAAPSPDAGAVLRCVQLVTECLQHLVIFRPLSEPEMVSFSLLGAGCWDTCCSSYKYKWNDNFPSDTDMKTSSLSICTARLLVLERRRTVLKNKGRNYWSWN